MSERRNPARKRSSASGERLNAMYFQLKYKIVQLVILFIARAQTAAGRIPALQVIV